MSNETGLTSPGASGEPSDYSSWKYERKLLVNIIKQNEETLSGGMQAISVDINQTITEFKEGIAQIIESISQISEAAEELAQSAGKQKDFVASILETQKDLQQSSTAAAADVDTLAKKLDDLNAVSFSITEMIDHNRDIAEQLHLISITGSIEAARAGGTLGGAFQVVANNIRGLAGNTAEIIARQESSLKQVLALIRESREGSGTVTSVLKGNRITAEDTTQLLVQLDTEMNTVAGSSIQLSSTVSQFMASIHQMEAGINNIAANLEKFRTFLSTEMTLSRKAASLTEQITRTAGKEASLHHAAQEICEYIRKDFLMADGTPMFALVRIFLSLPYMHLPDEYQGRLYAAESGETKRFLVLAGTAGEEEQWNSIDRSVNHKAIPLPAEEKDLSRIPMLAEMFRNMDVNYQEIIHPENIKRGLESIEGYMLVKEAEGSPYIPDQDSFIKRYSIKSELGMGGYLPSGAVFTCFIFSKEPLDERFAEKLKTLPVALQMAFLRFDTERRYWA